MTIAELKEKIKDLPGEMEVLIRIDSYGSIQHTEFEPVLIKVDSEKGLLLL